MFRARVLSPKRSANLMDLEVFGRQRCFTAFPQNVKVTVLTSKVDAAITDGGRR